MTAISNIRPSLMIFGIQFVFVIRVQSTEFRAVCHIIVAVMTKYCVFEQLFVRQLYVIANETL